MHICIHEQVGAMTFPGMRMTKFGSYICMGWGLLKLLSLISLLLNFFRLQNYMLDSSNHIHIIDRCCRS